MSSRTSPDFSEVRSLLAAPAKGKLLLFASCLLLVGCGWQPPGKPQYADRPLRPDQVLDFTTLFTNNCTGCHGSAGEFGAAPPLQDPLLLAILPPDEFRKIVIEGRAGTMMPPFDLKRGGRLTTEQIQILVDGIYKEWQDPNLKASALPSYAVSEAGSAEAGAEVYRQACAGCHGEAGSGGEKAGPLNDLAFLGVVSDQMIRRVVITGRHDLGMPDFRRESAGPDAKALTNQQIADVVAYLASWREPSAGRPQPQDANGNE